MKSGNGQSVVQGPSDSDQTPVDGGIYSEWYVVYTDDHNVNGRTSPTRVRVQADECLAMLLADPKVISACLVERLISERLVRV